MIVGIGSPEYAARWGRMGGSRWNGAYYYASELERLVVPHVDTERPWVLVEAGTCFDRSIVFVHDNINVERYGYMAACGDLILVCGVPETVPKVEHLGRAAYLPLSVDVSEVERYRVRRRHGTCYAGRLSKERGDLPSSVDVVGGMERGEFLSRLARYRYCYAVGRTAIEAKVLGVEVLPYDPRYPDPDVWQVMDSSEAVPLLQGIVDGVER